MFGNKKKEEDSMSYGIIGLGRFGTALATTLAQAGKEIMVLDRDEATFRRKLWRRRESRTAIR